MDVKPLFLKELPKRSRLNWVVCGQFSHSCTTLRVVGPHCACYPIRKGVVMFSAPNKKPGDLLKRLLCATVALAALSGVADGQTGVRTGNWWLQTCQESKRPPTAV